MNERSLINELKSSQRTIRFFETLMSASADGIVITDASNHIIIANDAFCGFLGRRRRDIIETNLFDWLELMGDRATSKWTRMEENVRREETAQNIEFNIEADGAMRYLSVNTSLLEQVASEERGVIVSIWRDITERKKMMEDLRTAKANAEKSDHLKSSFLANMSHEIRTPMNAVIGYTDVMLLDDISDKHKDYLHTVKTSGKLLLSLIDDILDISKIEAGQVEIERIPFSLVEVMNNVSSNTGALISSKGKDILIRSSFPDMISRSIKGDPTRVQQVLNNLIGNAVKFTHEGFIEIGVTLLDESTIEFYVTDTGKGIPPESQAEIFEPFRQSDMSDTRKYGGTGLGLAISRKLVELMGGEFRLESSVGEDHGSRFSFTIPYIPVEETESDILEQVSASEKKTGGKILLVEDVIVNRELARLILEKLGYNVEEAEDGQEAVSKYRSDNSIELILMDMQMPILDGLEATSQIRELEEKDQKENRIPIIALTASAMKGEKERCIDAGCNDYITKPINQNQLREVLEKYLGTE